MWVRFPPGTRSFCEAQKEKNQNPNSKEYSIFNIPNFKTSRRKRPNWNLVIGISSFRLVRSGSIDSLAPAHSPATIAGLTVYPARLPPAVFPPGTRIVCRRSSNTTEDGAPATSVWQELAPSTDRRGHSSVVTAERLASADQVQDGG
jgi:hypothetical protein